MNAYTELTSYCSIHNTTLVAVTKTKPNESILNLYEQGQRIFGENRIQELVDKQGTLPTDIQWHMIGHLQAKKVKHITPFVSMIHSGDRLSLLKEINKQAKKNNRKVDVLLQIKIAQEDSKQGWNIDDLKNALAHDSLLLNLENINYRGVMGMATFTDNKLQVASEFKALKSFFDTLKKDHFIHNSSFDTISMGMSGDYKIAIDQGATMIRVGSLLFGAK